ncbi:MAG: FG-GAP repeat protein, partial [Acidobacteriota bacterium]
VDDDDQYIHQGMLSQNGNNEDYDAFGFALTTTDFNGDGFDDLAVGVPAEDINTTVNAGWVMILFGTATGVSVDNTTISQSNGGGSVEEGDFFGWAVAAAPFELVSPDAIFVDGFDSGDTGAWTETFP